MHVKLVSVGGRRVETAIFASCRTVAVSTRTLAVKLTNEATEEGNGFHVLGSMFTK